MSRTTPIIQAAIPDLSNNDEKPFSGALSIEEKHFSPVDESDQLLDIPGYDVRLSWDQEEEAVAVRKVDLSILAFIVILFVFMQLDRTNIGNALTGGLEADIKVKTPQVNTATTLFTLGFVITEIPFNVISKRLGPEIFLPISMFLWGTCTWAQIFIRDRNGLWALRFFIGALEGGYIPGMVLYIKNYYTNKELGLRFAAFWSSNAVAGIVAGPLALALISLDGRYGLKGWQWLFAIGNFAFFLRI